MRRKHAASKRTYKHDTTPEDVNAITSSRQDGKLTVTPSKAGSYIDGFLDGCRDVWLYPLLQGFPDHSHLQKREGNNHKVGL